MSILVIIRYSRRDGNMNSQSKNEKFVNFPCPSLVEQHQYAPLLRPFVSRTLAERKEFSPLCRTIPGTIVL